MLYRIHDLVAKTETRWDTTAKEVKVIHWSENTPEGDASETRCSGGGNTLIVDGVSYTGTR